MASFWDTLFGGAAEKEAADKNRALYSQYQTDGTKNLGNGLTQSLGSLGTGYGDANSQLGQNRDVWSGYGATANGALDRGLSSSLGALGQARSDYDPLAALGQKYGQGTSLYMDSLGANGAAGNQHAVDSFHAGPGYQFQVDQGNDAINRRRAAGGMLNSGNADIDAMKFGQGLANQEYGNWQTKLGGFMSPELQATSGAAAGRAGVNGQIAGLYGQDATNRVGVAGSVAQGQAGANSAIAGNLASLGAGQAGLYSQNASDLTNLAGSVTSGNAQANNAEAAGKAAGAKNLLGAGMSLATLAAGGNPFGGSLTGSGFSGLGNTPASAGNSGGLFARLAANAPGSGSGMFFNNSPWSVG
ncbi:hypothetical protein FNL56_18370 [Tardiphaga sp. vice304]|uniref:hypothetical protein n=1 Tax=Tardiphaga sp. vice304 TaxID=2592817 RepID=UPI00116267C8|nr:hypothetical protein [Tardiphaga sp. vice304]QDM27874.1 hypothetical protein FNL56_18370 [Tardiphaga sp. vice304]